MSHDWMIRVIEDLQGYAQLNGFHSLAEQLDQARVMAITEAANMLDEAELDEFQP